MEDYRIWGRIEQTAPSEFAAIATAVPDNADPIGIRNLTGLAESRDAALELLRHYVERLSRAIEAGGDRLIETELDGI